MAAITFLHPMRRRWNRGTFAKSKMNANEAAPASAPATTNTGRRVMAIPQVASIGTDRETSPMTVGQLKAKYQEVFGEMSRSNHKQFLFRRIACRMQANAYGGLSERARRRTLEIANDADLRIRAPKNFLT